MAQQTKTCAFKGFGYRGTPCTKERVEDSFMCSEHREMFAEWREEAQSDPRLLYSQRSDNPNRKFERGGKGQPPKRRPHLPTCCRPGCYEIRTPPDPFCSPACEAMMGDID